MTAEDTIFALSTAPGRAGLAVIRLSGPLAGPTLCRLSGRPDFPPRQAILCRFADPDSGEVLDRGLGLFFAAPASFTGEDVAELQVHGGRAVVDGILDVLEALPGLRMAEAGEFSRRAFANGRMDLTEAEGLLDLIHAETAMQRRQALGQMSGALSRLYDGWRGELTNVMAFMESVIDFPEDELPPDLLEQVESRVGALRAALEVHLADGRRGEKLRQGYRIAIVGAPNAGKSTLCNRLAQRDVAIVSHHAGTTRDVIEVHLDMQGYPVILADTAGLRDAAGEIEEEGIRRAFSRAGEADLILGVFDTLADAPDAHTLGLVTSRPSLAVLNKQDAASSSSGFQDLLPRAVIVSARTGAGMDRLLQEIGKRVVEAMSGDEGVVLSRRRHRNALERCRSFLQDFSTGKPEELAAEDLRLAARELGRITGHIAVDDVLERIFSGFCIGK